MEAIRDDINAKTARYHGLKKAGIPLIVSIGIDQALTASGHWRLTLDIEAEGFSAYRAVAEFEWREAKPPYSPGSSLV